LITDFEGVEYEHLEYTPYGELWIEPTRADSTYETPFRFTAKEWDEETNLYYYGARYMDPKTSRWISADPSGSDLVNPMNSEGKPKENYLIIESTNWYSYVSNNPVNFTDPTGLNAAFVNIRNSDWHGHMMALVQDANGYWVAADFWGSANNHVKAIIDDTDDPDIGKFALRHTGTKDLHEAIAYARGQQRPDLPLEYAAFELETTGASDAMMIERMVEFDKMYNPSKYGIDANPADAPRYRFIGNSCIDNAIDILSTGGMNMPFHLLVPNWTMDVLDVWNFQADQDVFNPNRDENNPVNVLRKLEYSESEQ
jgi:RHS repeat-associated protein